MLTIQITFVRIPHATTVGISKLLTFTSNNGAKLMPVIPLSKHDVNLLKNLRRDINDLIDKVE